MTAILVSKEKNMSICTFFGHRKCCKDIDDILAKTIIELIGKGVDLFYVGNQGDFDRKAISILKKLSVEYPDIKYFVVLAYFPLNKESSEFCSVYPTVIPVGIENVFPSYAIYWRNNWMLDKADFVVTYVNKSYGGASKFAEKALKKGKKVINLADKNNLLSE